jgi:PAS domain S-box-containing protein
MLAVLLTLSGAATAQAPGSEARSVRVALVRNWPPAYGTTPEGRPTGFAVELFNELAARTGLTVRYRIYGDIDELHDGLQRGEIDAIPSYGKSSERAERLLFTQPFETMPVVLFVRASTQDVHELADLAGRQVAVVRTNVARGLLEPREDLQTEVYPDVRSALFALLAGQVDALAYPEPVIWRLAADARLDRRIRRVGAPLVEVRRAIAVPREQPELHARLDAALDELLPTARFREIYTRWHSQPPPYWSPGRIVAASGVLSVGVLLLMLTWRYRSVVVLNRRLLESSAERERAEAALRETRERYRQLVEHGADVCLLHRPDGTILFASASVSGVLGYGVEELLGRNARELLHPSDVEGVFSTFAGVVRRPGDPVAASYRVRHKDGSWRWMEGTAKSLLAEPSVRAIVVNQHDISEKRKAEQQRGQLEEQVRQAQKMEAVGRLAAGVAHDFNNLLSVIQGYAELLESEMEPGDDRLQRIEQILHATGRAEELTRQLLALGRKEVAEPRPVELGTLAAGLEPMLRRLAGGEVELALERAAEPVNVWADPGQLEQVLLNLTVNARDAMPRGGRLGISVRRIELDGAVGSRLGVEPGAYGAIEVGDSGTGMDAETRARIFEPFFTTKGPGKGTGLGLTTVYGIVRQSRGGIEVESEPGCGTVFRIVLPSSELDALPAATAGAGQRGAHGSETILVAEDEPGVRALASEILVAHGYEVLAAADPQEALELARGRAEAIDLLLTDVMMPGMNGRELAGLLTAERPGLKVLYISGYAAEMIADHGVLAAGVRLLRKPFSTQALASAVREALDATR